MAKIRGDDPAHDLPAGEKDRLEKGLRRRRRRDRAATAERRPAKKRPGKRDFAPQVETSALEGATDDMKPSISLTTGVKLNRRYQKLLAEDWTEQTLDKVLKLLTDQTRGRSVGKSETDNRRSCSLSRCFPRIFYTIGRKSARRRERKSPRTRCLQSKPKSDFLFALPVRLRDRGRLGAFRRFAESALSMRGSRFASSP